MQYIMEAWQHIMDIWNYTIATWPSMLMVVAFFIAIGTGVILFSYELTHDDTKQEREDIDGVVK